MGVSIALCGATTLMHVALDRSGWLCLARRKYATTLVCQYRPLDFNSDTT